MVKRIHIIGIFCSLFLSFMSTVHAENLLFDEVDLYVSSPNYEDRLRIRLNEVTTDGYDIRDDAFKFLSSAVDVPQLYSRIAVSEGIYNLTVNSLPRNIAGITNVPLSLRYGEKGLYTIRIDMPEKTPTCTQILLIDSISSSNVKVTDLKTTPQYSFSSTATPGTTTHTRFKLKIYSEIPQVAITADSPKLSCAYPTDTLRANATLGCTYQWSTGATTPYIVANKPGEYGVIVTHIATGKTASDKITITLDTIHPTLSLTSPTTELTCNTSSIRISSVANNVSYLWSNGSTRSFLNVTEAGDYSLSVTSIDNGCSTTVVKTITKNITSPQVSIESSVPELSCANRDMQLTVVSDNVSYLWSTGESTNQIIVSNVGDYSVKVTDLYNGCSNTVNKTVSENTILPIVEITISSNVLTCDIDTVKLIAVSDNASYLWLTGETTKQIAVTKAGNYSVTVTDLRNGCKSSVNSIITENYNQPALEIQAYETELTCTSTGVILTALSESENLQYKWSSGEEVNEIIVYNPGDYSVTAKDTSTGCSSTITQSISQNIIPPTVEIISSAKEISEQTPNIKLSAVSDNVTYLWSTGEETSEIEITEAGFYSVTVYNLVNGCTAFDTITITDPVIIPSIPYYYRSIRDGNWFNKELWEISTNGNIWQPSTTVPDKNAISVNLASNVSINAGQSVDINVLEIHPNGELINEGNFVIEKSISFVVNENGTSQFKNKGSVANHGIIKIRKKFKAADGWTFVSFPFDVYASNIVVSGTSTLASWGNLNESRKDFYVVEYNGLQRDYFGNACQNWKNINPRILYANKGYIISVATDKTIDFVSSAAPNTSLFNTTNTTVKINEYKTNKSMENRSWNLVGLPFGYSYDLIQASQDQAPFYYYNGNTYETVMAGDNYQIPPFTSFYLQANPKAAMPSSLTFSTEAPLYTSTVISAFDEVTLAVKNEKYSDKVRIRLQEGATTAYEIGKDAVKFFSPKSGVPQIYCKQGDLELSVNAIPVTSAKTDVNIKISETGTYRICLEDMIIDEDYEQIILVDNETNKKTDLLLNGSYTFIAKAGSVKSLSVLFVTTGTIVVDTKKFGTILVKVIGNKVYITGLDGSATVCVYELISNKLAHRFTNVKNGQVLSLGVSGICIIDVQTPVQKNKMKAIIKRY